MIKLKTFSGGKRRPINLFFTEIIIALLFFSFSGAVILKVFATAELKSQKSEQLERVIIFAQSFAEVFSESGDFYTAAELILGDNIAVEEDAVLLENDNADPQMSIYENSGCRIRKLPLEDGSVYFQTAETRYSTGAGEISDLSMTFTADGEEIYSLRCSAYIGGEPDE